MFSKYDLHQTYEWNYQHPPATVDVSVPKLPGNWNFCGLTVDSPLGIPAGPLLNGKWCLYYASLGFDVLTYKTVRSRERECYLPPNLQPVIAGQVDGTEAELTAANELTGSWAVSYGMPSRAPEIWRKDVEETKKRMPRGKVLVVSVVASVQPGWTIDELANDYAQCAKWAVEMGADAVETNFSCPNVSTCDGQLFQQPEDAKLVAERVRQSVGRTPYIVKIGHVPTKQAASDLVDALADKVDAFAMTNSVATRVRKENKLLFDGQPRGICGHAILEASIRQVELFAELVRQRSLALDLIGVGGISTAEHVRRYISAGASACQLATAAMTNPGLAIEIKRDLARQ